LKSSSLSYLINGPGLLEPQLEKLANHVVNDLKLSHVAIFHADDDFSSAGAQYLVQLLKKLGQEPVGVERYNRFTLNIYTPAQKLVDKDPRAIFCISTSMPTVKLINYFFENGCISTRFFGIDSTFLVKDILRFKGVPFHYASSVPDPVVSTIPLAQEYRNDLAKYFMDEDPNVLSFSYYLGARLITDALKKVSTPISADTVLDQLSAMKETEFGGMPIHFDGNNRHIFGQKIWII